MPLNMNFFKTILLITASLLITNCKQNTDIKDINFETRFETSKGTQTPTYQEVISFYEKLSQAYNSVALYTMKETDSGEPLHLVTFNPNRTFESEFSKSEQKTILLIMSVFITCLAFTQTTLNEGFESWPPYSY